MPADAPRHGRSDRSNDARKDVDDPDDDLQRVNAREEHAEGDRRDDRELHRLAAQRLRVQRAFRPKDHGGRGYPAPMDWGLFHAVNELGRHRDGVQDTALAYNASAIFVIVALAGCLWFLARPGGALKPKLAAASAAFSVVLGLLMNVVAGSLVASRPAIRRPPRHRRRRPPRGRQPEFPSDHATVAFAAAFAVLVFYRRLGALLVLAAIGVAVARVLVGVHYPIDVAASAVIGGVSAAIVTVAARPHVTWVVRQASRLSDPLVAAARSVASRD